MIYDFSKICNSYDKDFYKSEHFRHTPCPGCLAIGRFKLHGSYERHAMFFWNNTITCKSLDIKRIRCKSCGATHAVMPGDIIPYKALTLLVLILVLAKVYLKKIPVLKIARRWDISFQLIYLAVCVFKRHLNNIRQYVREKFPDSAHPNPSAEGTVALIRKLRGEFQPGYIRASRRPCFMCKFLDKAGSPPVGIYAPIGAAT